MDQENHGDVIIFGMQFETVRVVQLSTDNSKVESLTFAL